MIERKIIFSQHSPVANTYEFRVDEEGHAVPTLAQEQAKKGKNMENVNTTQMAEQIEKLDERYTDEQLAEVLAISDTEQSAEDINPLEALEAIGTDDR